MSSYNLMKREDCQRMIDARRAELAAILDGSWPRDSDDYFRWNPPAGWERNKWAEKICRSEIEYCSDRINDGRAK